MPPVTLRNPFSMEVIAERAHDDDASLDEKLGAVRRAQPGWARVPVAERVEALRGGLDYFDRNREAIAAEVTALMGKPLAQSRNELGGFFERAEYLLGAAGGALAAEVLPEKAGFLRRIEHVPHGVVFIISAWNYPLMISLNGVLAALLAGNTVLLKHARATAPIGDHFERAFGGLAGHPDLLRHAFTAHDRAGGLIRERRVDHVVFTGSVEGGREISRHCGEAMLDCHLELGGKDAAYVAADADAAAAAETIVDGCMYNAGQSCCGIERVFVHEAVLDAFLARARELIGAYRLGDPMDPGTTMGPLADPGAAELMAAQVEEARAGGAEILTGGRPRRIGGAVFFEPTLVLGASPSMAIFQEENFGPVLPVVAVGGDAEAVARVNGCRFGLTAALFTTSVGRAERLSSQIEAGTVYLNRCDYLDPELPWTGHKESGRGTGLSRFAFLGMTRRKAIHFRLPS